MGYRVLQNSFLGGVVSPALLGRVDLANYQQGAYELTNFLVQPQGSVTARGGFRYVAPVKNHNEKVRLIPFRFASDQTLVLVFGDRWMRIVTEGKVLLSGGAPYELATPYSAEEIFELEYTQNADILTLTNPNHPPAELRRYGATDWRFVECSFSAEIDPPENLSAVAIYPSGVDSNDRDTVTAEYVVTAVDFNGKESVASLSVSTQCNYYLTGGSVEISWEPVSGAQFYRVYRNVAGVFGFLGQTEGTLIIDVGDNPDTTYTPPRYESVFAGTSGIKSIEVIDGGSGYTNKDSGSGGSVLYISFLPVYRYESRDATADSSEIPERTFYWTVTFISPEGQQYVGTVKEANVIGANGGDGSVERGYIACGKYDSTKGFPVTFTGSVPNVTKGWKVKCGYGNSGSFYSCYPTAVGQVFNNGPANSHAALCTWDALSKYKDMWESSAGLDAIMVVKASGSQSEKLELSISGGTGAEAQATAINGVIVFVTVLAAGSGYSENSQVTVLSQAGSGAQFKVHLFGEGDIDYPSANTQYDQRRIFAGSYANPVKILMTNAGQQDLMMYHLPTMADDRIVIEAVTADADRIIHAVALDSLLLFTRSAELRVFTQNSDALSPDSVAVRVQSYIGANQVQPVIANANVLYAASRGGHLRTLSYTYTAQGYSSDDLSLVASHLFDGKDIVDMTLSKAPTQIVWCVSSDGHLNAMTYYPEQNISAWSVLETDGAFESCCVVSEGVEDHLYVVVRRTINGATRRYIERLEYVAVPEDNAKCRQFDCFIDNQEPMMAARSNTLTGLEHLEGKTVVAFVDGTPAGEYVVQGGSITIDRTGSNVAVGLPYKSRLITVPLADDAAQGKMQSLFKNLINVFFRVRFAGDLWVSAYGSGEFWEVDRDALEYQDQDEGNQTVNVNVTSAWEDNGQILVEHRDALPLEISAIVGETSFEGYKK